MPYKPMGPCSVRGCRGRAVRRGRCEKHAAEAAAQYRAEHPDTRPSATARGYGAPWREIRERHLSRQPWCVECMANGQRVKGTHVDHIAPRSRGGTDDASNLQTLCARHHAVKTAMFDGGFGNAKRDDFRAR